MRKILSPNVNLSMQGGITGIKFSRRVTIESLWKVYDPKRDLCYPVIPLRQVRRESNGMYTYYIASEAGFRLLQYMVVVLKIKPNAFINNLKPVTIKTFVFSCSAKYIDAGWNGVGLFGKTEAGVPIYRNFVNHYRIHFYSSNCSKVKPLVVDDQAYNDLDYLYTSNKYIKF